jgi:hypothetical protein
MWSGKRPWKEMRGDLRLQLRLHERIGVEGYQYPSIPRIAADPWLRGKPKFLEKLKAE